MKFNRLLYILAKMALYCFLFSLVVIRSTHALSTEKSKTLVNNHNTPSPQAVKSALNGYQWALNHGDVANKSVLTIVDFTKPSYEKRLWVIDLKNGKILMHMHVAQGRNTGTVYAKYFSNQPGSHESSPGLFTTQDIYGGEHGESLRINGLEKGINNNALNRAIVIHPASYVTPSFIKENGYTGRSWGCFAVNPAKADKFIRLIKDGSVFFAYAAPEARDQLVDHQLSSVNERLYDLIMHVSSRSHWFF